MYNQIIMQPNYICIGRKISQGNVEFLDFAVDDNDRLIVFNTFKEASEFLKKEVGTGEELLDYIITTVEAQKDNPRMKDILKLGMTSQDQQENAGHKPTEVLSVNAESKSNEEKEVEVYFSLSCTDFKVLNNDSILDEINNRQLVPIIGFVDAKDPNQLVQVPNFKLRHSFIGEVQEEN